jgi:hypothetical protein
LNKEEVKMPETKKFCVYEFSKKFDSLQKEGIWVSGGYMTNKKQAFDRSNYKNGSINEIPDKIRQAFIEGLFEIPNAYPTNSLNDEEFSNLLKTGLDIAHPPIEDVALIARDLDGYCVLAVATRQIDDKWRSKLIGYRFFWLTISDLPSEINYSVDGIATLLEWWHENRMPRFAMNPSSYQNEDINYFSQKVRYKHQTIQSYEQKGQISESGSNPYLFEKTVHGDINYRELHTQAVHRSNICTLTAWAWNVRKLTKPETFTVVYCADRASYEQFFSPVIKYIDPQQPKIEMGETDSYQNLQQVNHSSSVYLKVQQVPDQQASNQQVSNQQASNQQASNQQVSDQYQDTSPLKKYFEDVAKQTNSRSLQSLITFYEKQPPVAEKSDSWLILYQEAFNNLKDKVSQKKVRQNDVEYIILVSVFIWTLLCYGPKQDIINFYNNNNFNDKQKKWADEYLNKFSESINYYQADNDRSVKKLKRNIDKLEKELLGKNSNKGDQSQPSSKSNNGFSETKLWNKKGNVPTKIIISVFILIVLVYLIQVINSLIYPIKDSQTPNLSLELQAEIKKLETARQFITENSVTTKCDDSISVAESEECEIYKKAKGKLPDWPKLPEPPQNAPNPTPQKSPPRMLARNRGQYNPPELVQFLQQSLKILGEQQLSVSKTFDRTLEESVKKFQDRCQESQDGQVGEETWECLSNYVQKEQVLAILDYQIESLNQNKKNREIEEHIQGCKHRNELKPEDFIKCVKASEDDANG